MLLVLVVLQCRCCRCTRASAELRGRPEGLYGRALNSTLVSEHTQITAPAVAAATDAALAAINAATTMSELRAARSSHAGEASPLALFNASMKNVPAEDRAAAGKLIGTARAAVGQALASREADLAVA